MLVFKRVTTPAEAEILRTIRNDCKDYMTRSTDYITPVQQEEWFKTAYKKYELYIAYAIEHGAIAVNAGFGVIHLEPDQYLLTGGLTQDYRDKGLGTPLFKFLIDNCNKQLPIRLEVLKDNTRAYKTYEKLGFVPTGEVNDRVIFMEYKYDSVI